MNLTYENATEQDIENIYEFNKYLIDRYENVQNIDYEKVLNWVHKKIETNIQEYQRVIVDDEVAGYYRFYQDGDKMELDDLYIFPEYRNQQIGTKVIEKCLTETDLPVYLYVFIKNAKAVALYERLGFRVIETIKDSRYIMQEDGRKSRRENDGA